MLILIADDERLARLTLKSMLGGILSQPYSVVEVQDGKALVDQCRMHRPDIAFVDINMPQLDGISAIEQCREELPLTRFVITTGYSDFSYAQKCITLGVTEYLLKPLEEEKLALLLERLLELRSADRETSNTAFQVRILHYFQAMDEIGSCDEPEDDTDERYTLYEFYMDGAQQPGDYAACYRSLRKRLTDTAEELLPDGVRYALFHSPDGNLRVALRFPSARQSCVEAAIDRVCRAESIPPVITSALFVRGEALQLLHKDACAMSAASWRRYLNAPAHAHFFAGGEGEGDPFLRALDAAFIGFIAADEIAYRDAVQQLSCLDLKFASERQLTGALAFAHAITGCAGGATNAKQLAAALLKAAPLMYRAAAQSGESDKASQVKAYIDAHYMDDISINLLAERFFLTPNYLSRLFHEKTGIRFVEYLTGVRIANAKRLLKQNPTALVKDIAVMVGYYSARHFSATFKRETGLYPAEFRDIVI